VMCAVVAALERFSVDVNRNNKGVPRGSQIRFELL
jgi:N-formylglutamate amidohydrolase